jgi:hypothetical protein
MAEPELLNPYGLQRRWNQLKRRFDNLRGWEGVYAHLLVLGELQAAYVAGLHPELTSSDIAQAYTQVGVRVAMELDPTLRYRFEGFNGSVQELVRRCLATCHPDYNPQLAATAEECWHDQADRQTHFRNWGAVYRRLADSAAFWARRGSRAYVQFLSDFLADAGLQPNPDQIHFAVMGNHPPE